MKRFSYIELNQCLMTGFYFVFLSPNRVIDYMDWVGRQEQRLEPQAHQLALFTTVFPFPQSLFNTFFEVTDQFFFSSIFKGKNYDVITLFKNLFHIIITFVPPEFPAVFPVKFFELLIGEMKLDQIERISFQLTFYLASVVL